MFLLDDQNEIIDAECSLDLFENSPCVVVESSGGANPARGVTRRNPDYNKLLRVLFGRLGQLGTQITRVVLDSSKVAAVPVEDRIARLNRPYPIDLSSTDIEEFRKTLQREIASMHRDPTATQSGNAQKRIRICLSESIDADQILSSPNGTVPPPQVPEPTPGLNDTEKAYLRLSRIGQGQYRKDLVVAFNSTCPITGITNQELLVASHIKPWKACTNSERLDKQNGILVSALIDRLFDRGLITFSEDGAIVISPRLSAEDRKKCGLDLASKINLPERSLQYMQYHRAIEFKNT